MYGVILNFHCTKTATPPQTIKEKKTDKKNRVITVAQRYCKDCSVKRKTGACPKRSRPPWLFGKTNVHTSSFQQLQGGRLWFVLQKCLTFFFFFFFWLSRQRHQQVSSQTSRGVGSLPNAVTHNFREVFFLNSCSNVIINSSVFAASSHLKIVTVAHLMVNKIKCERDDKYIFEIHCFSLNLQICSETKAKLRFLYLI